MKINMEGLMNFQYIPKGLGTLSQYDRNPLVFVLDIQGPYLLAVNVHWIHKSKREKFLTDLQEIMGKTIGRGKKRERFRLIYTLLKTRKYRGGLDAVRKYFTYAIINLREVPKDKWDRVLDIKRYQSDIRKKDDNYRKQK